MINPGLAILTLGIFLLQDRHRNNLIQFLASGIVVLCFAGILLLTIEIFVFAINHWQLLGKPSDYQTIAINLLIIGVSAVVTMTVSGGLYSWLRLKLKTDLFLAIYLIIFFIALYINF